MVGGHTWGPHRWPERMQLQHDQSIVQLVCVCVQLTFAFVVAELSTTPSSDLPSLSSVMHDANSLGHTQVLYIIDNNKSDLILSYGGLCKKCYSSNFVGFYLAGDFRFRR